jgi:hypothetical protein
MSVLREVAEELFSMFVGDARLAAGIAIIVAVSAAAARTFHPWLGGVVLLLGCLGLLVDSVLRAARKAR